MDNEREKPYKLVSSPDTAWPRNRYYTANASCRYAIAWRCRKCGAANKELRSAVFAEDRAGTERDAAENGFIDGKMYFSSFAQEVNRAPKNEASELTRFSLLLGKGICSSCGDLQPWGSSFTCGALDPLWQRLHAVCSVILSFLLGSAFILLIALMLWYADLRMASSGLTHFSSAFPVLAVLSILFITVSSGVLSGIRKKSKQLEPPEIFGHQASQARPGRMALLMVLGILSASACLFTGFDLPFSILTTLLSLFCLIVALIPAFKLLHLRSQARAGVSAMLKDGRQDRFPMVSDGIVQPQLHQDDPRADLLRSAVPDYTIYTGSHYSSLPRGPLIRTRL